MAKLNSIKLDVHPRGDSGVLRWSWVKKNDDQTTTPLSLVGYKLAFTVKVPEFDYDANDNSAAKGYNDTLWRTDIDCDNPTQMHGIDPTQGMCLIPFPKQANWVTPGTYNFDIVLENKSSHRTTTVALGKIEIQGHPTNRLTTDEPDTFDDIEES